MAVRQLLSPNLDNDPNNPLYIYQGGKLLTDWYGWCLAVAAGSFKAQGGSYSAKTAWQSCNTKHSDFDLPEKVWVPVWWEGGQYGHVAEAYRDGNTLIVYSSPYTHKATFEVFKGDIVSILNYIGSVYGVGNFTGWSETLLNSRIIEFYTEEPTPELVPEPVPDPVPTPAPEPETSEEPSEDNKKEEEQMAVPTENQQIIADIVEESSSIFHPSDKTKLIIYIIIDILFFSSIMLPFAADFIEAETLRARLLCISQALTTAGAYWALVFKLIKKKK